LSYKAEKNNSVIIELLKPFDCAPKTLIAFNANDKIVSLVTANNEVCIRDNLLKLVSAKKSHKHLIFNIFSVKSGRCKLVFIFVQLKFLYFF
jgi:hypothetical protein